MTSPDNASSSRKQQDRSQQANTDTSSSSTAHAGPQTFEATTAVLDTNELLHLIVSAVPSEHRTALRRVSKNWQAAVLKIGHVFEPIDYDECPYGDDFARKFDYYGYGPVYALENEFALHPMLRCRSHMHNDGIDPDYDWSHLLDFVRDFSLTELTAWRHEFITDPPLSQLMIHAGASEVEVSVNGQVATLRVREGIRFGDLLEYFGKLDAVASIAHKSASFAVRYYPNTSDDDSEGSAVVIGQGREGHILDEAQA
jgi:hypothetical protein